MASGEEQRLLTSHRAADRVDTVPLDIDAVSLCDRRHPGQVGDLAGGAPGVEPEPPALPGRVDDREVASPRQVAEEAGVLAGRDAAPVR